MSLPSVRDELVIDIFAHSEGNILAILIDRPFSKDLVALELLKQTQELHFIFADGEKKELGDPLKDELMPYFLPRTNVNIFQVDADVKKAEDGWIVPLTIVE